MTKPPKISAKNIGLSCILFFLLHLSALLVFFVPFKWSFLAAGFLSYGIRMFGITAGYHRYFSHKSYKTGRLPQFLIAWIGASAAQKGPLWWAANHRHHHRHSDQPADLHSPLQKGFWWSHVGWILSPKHEETLWKEIPDLVKFPELLWLNRFHLIPPTALALATYALGGIGGFVWGFCVPTVFLWHCTFAINSLAHVFGSIRYSTTDTSRNNFWLALITLGEGWHNNHHCFMASANQGFYWWEIDISYGVLKVLSWTGIVRNLKKPPLELLKSKLLKPSPRDRKTIPLGKDEAQLLWHA